ncbi:hypothetical protein ACFLQX_00625 [Bacteroidota bacterium]
MSHFKKTFLPILLTGLWINLFETIIWILLVKSYWIDRYNEMNIEFIEETINFVVWGIWGFSFAAVIFILAKKFSLIQTTFLSWFIVFIMMWMVVYNAGVLPTKMLWFNAPLSFIGTFAAVWICKKMMPKQ